MQDVSYPFEFTSNHNSTNSAPGFTVVSYPFEFTSNHNSHLISIFIGFVSYPFEFTSNHNRHCSRTKQLKFLILLNLHQTTTKKYKPELADSFLSF